MAGEGEQILIYSSHQLFLIHKCFINLTHDLKPELYYNADGNSFFLSCMHSCIMRLNMRAVQLETF